MPRHEEDDEKELSAPGASLLSFVAPAAEHLVNAIGEIAAAGQAVMDAVPERTRRRYSRTLAVGGTALGFVGSIAKSAAGAARSRSRDRARKEALREIAAALDAHAEKLAPKEAKAIRAVREVISEKPAPQRKGTKRAARSVARRKGTRAGIQRELDSLKDTE